MALDAPARRSARRERGATQVPCARARPRPPAATADACRLRSVARGERAADPRGWRFPADAGGGAPRDRRAARHPALPARSGAGADPAAAARGRAPGAVGRPHAALADDRRRGARDAHRDPPARPARAAAPGRALRRARPPLPRPEDRGHRRGAARHLLLLRPRRRGRRDPRPRHDPRDRRLQHGLRDREPLARGARRGARRRLGELLPPARPARRCSASRSASTRSPTSASAGPTSAPCGPASSPPAGPSGSPLDAVVMRERWQRRRAARATRSAPSVDRAAAIAARDRLDQLVKPAAASARSRA